MPFRKGQSGNPGGRPKEIAELRNLARQHTAFAIERLVFWAKSDEARASVAACMALLDRGWGRPAQPVGGAKDLGPMEVTGKGIHLLPPMSREEWIRKYCPGAVEPERLAPAE